MKLKLMTYNIQHCFDYVRKDRIDLKLFADAIISSEADIIGLNEVRGLGEHKNYTAQAETLAKLTSYNHYFAQAIYVPGGGPYGNAILSKYPILNASTIKIPDPLIKDEKTFYETRCLLKAKIDVCGGVDILVSHFGLAKSEQKNAVEVVLENAPNKKCVFMGDLNTQPDSDIIAQLSNRMQDTAAFFDAPKLSFPSDNPEIKIDYIFVSNDIKVISADIPDLVVSDHRPHIAVVEI